MRKESTANLVGYWRQSWIMMGNTAQGRSHLAKNVPCQDKVFCLLQGGTSVIALADGAGSAAHSELGAEAATKTVCDYVANNFDAIVGTSNVMDVKHNILNHVLSALQEISNDFTWELTSLASTLLFVAVKGETCLVGHIGDGVICCRANGTLKAISLPSNGEFANSTTFVTSPNALSDFRLYKGKVDNIEGFCLMSDGASESLYDKRTHEVANMVGKVFTATDYLSDQDCEEYFQRLLSDLLIQHTRDDCSLVVMKKANSAAAILSMSEQDFLRLLGIQKGRSSRAMRLIIKELSIRPQNRIALTRKLHMSDKAISRRLRILISHNLAMFCNGMYYIR